MQASLAANLRTLGAEAFSLVSILTNGSLFDSLFVLNALSATETVADFLQKYSSYDQTIMRNCVISSIGFFNNRCADKRRFGSYFVNLPIAVALLETLELQEFEKFIQAFHPTGLSDAAKEASIDYFILNHTLSSEENSLPFFLILLMRDNHTAQNFLQENPEVVGKLLKDKRYITQIEKNTSLQKKLALALTLTSQPVIDSNSTKSVVDSDSVKSAGDSGEVKSAGDSNEVKFAEESDPIHSALKPWDSYYSAFFRYIQPNSDSTHEKIFESFCAGTEQGETPESLIQKYLVLFQEHKNLEGLKPKIAFGEYIELVKLTEFFPQLFLIRTDDPHVKHDILKRAAAHCANYKDWNSMVQHQFDSWMKLSFDTSSKAELNELFASYKKEVGMIFSALDKCTPYNFLSLLAKWTDEPFPFPLAEYFTGATLNKLQTTLKAIPFKKKLLSYTNLGLPFADYYPDLYNADKSLEALAEDAPVAAVDDILEKARITFETKLLAKYPFSPLASYFAFKQSPVVTNRLAAYQALEHLLSRLEKQDAGTANTDEILDQLRDLLQKSGLDLATLELARISLKKHPLLFSALLTLIHDSPNFELNSVLRTGMEKQNDALHDMPLLGMQFSIIANRYIEKDRDTIPGDVLCALARAHGEKVLPTIEKYQLSDKVTNGTQLHKVFSQIKEGANTLENKAISEQQIIHALIQKFQTLVDSISINPEAISSEAVHTFYVELQTTTQKNKIVHSDLAAFIENYPAQNKGNILAWIVKLAFQQHAFAKDALRQWYAHEALKRQILPMLYQSTRTYAGQQNPNITAVAHLFDEDFLHDLVNYHLTQADPNQRDFEFIKDYISLSLQSGKLTYPMLRNEFDVNIQPLVLKELFNAQEDITFAKIEVLFGRDNVLPIVRDVLDVLPEEQLSAAFCEEIISHAQTQQQHAADAKEEDDSGDAKRVIMQLESEYGVENRNKILAAYLMHHNAVFRWADSKNGVKDIPICQLLIKGRITLDTLCHLELAELQTLITLSSYLENTANAEITKDSPIFRVPSALLLLFPLLEQGVLSQAAFEQLEPDSLVGNAYKTILRESDWKSAAAVVSKLHVARDFPSTPYFQFIQTNILDPLQNEVTRLHEEGGNEKSQAMKEAKDEVERCIVDVFREPSYDINSVAHTLHARLTKLVRSISERPGLNANRSHVGAFFRGLLGALLAISLFLIPLAYQKFRYTFFLPYSTSVLKKMDESVRYTRPVLVR